MIVAPYTIRFVWGPRKETLAACAGRVAAFVRDLRGINPEWTGFQHFDRKDKWFKLGSTVPPVSRALALGRTHDQFPPYRPIPDLGWRLTFANDYETHPLNFEILCGCYSENVSNVVSGNAAVDNVPTLLRLMRSIVDRWEPDHGIVYTRDVQPPSRWDATQTEAGIISYVTARFAGVSKRLPAFAYEDCGEGTLISLTGFVLDDVTTAKRHVRRLQGTIKPATLARP